MSKVSKVGIFRILSPLERPSRAASIDRLESMPAKTGAPQVESTSAGLTQRKKTEQDGKKDVKPAKKGRFA